MATYCFECGVEVSEFQKVVRNGRVFCSQTHATSSARPTAAPPQVKPSSQPAPAQNPPRPAPAAQPATGPWKWTCIALAALIANPSDRLPTVTSIKIPHGADDVRVRRQLLDEFGIEIAGGIGPLKGKIWRVGLMGYISQAKHILFFLAALEKVLCDQGFRVPSGAAVGTAISFYSREEVAALTPRA